MKCGISQRTRRGSWPLHAFWLACATGVAVTMLPGMALPGMALPGMAPTGDTTMLALPGIFSPARPGGYAHAAAKSDAMLIAQAAPEIAAMKPGDRYQQTKGILEILGLTREPKEDGTHFTLAFRFITDREAFGMNVYEFIRLYADGIPRAPSMASNSGATIPREAALEFSATFVVPGEPREVIVQFGYPDTPRTRRRWPG